MRRLLVERDFPVDDIRYFASARSAGRDARRGSGDEIVVEDAATADFAGLDIALFSAGGATSQRARPDGRGRGRHRHRQLVGLAHGPRRPARRPRGQRRTRSTSIPKGIVANPNCTTMVAMPVLKPLDVEAGLRRLVVSTYQAVSGAGLAGVDELAGADRGRRWRRQGRAAHLRRRRARRSRRARSSPTPSPSTCCRIAGSVARRRLRRDRRGAEAPQREPQDPRPPRPAGVGHLRAGAGVHRPLAVDQRRVRAADLARPGPRAPGRGAGRRARRHARRRSRPPASTRRSSAASASTDRSSTASPCSCRATTCARAPPSTRSRSPKSSCRRRS